MPPEDQSRQAPFQPNRVSGLKCCSLAFRRLVIGDPHGIIGPGTVGEVKLLIVVLRQTPVSQMLDLDLLGQAGDRAEVIHVLVGGDQVVEVIAAGEILERVHDSPRIAIIKPRPS